MTVEIFILSGVRQGERMMLDGSGFRVGTSPDCEVCFDPRADAGAANRSAAFRLMEDGWYIVNATGAILLNHCALAVPMRIASGDIVRMSESGPDFSFRIVTGAARQETMAPVGQSASALSPSIPPISARPEVSLPPVGAIPEPATPPPLSLPASSPLIPAYVECSTTKAATKERWIFLAVGGLVLCVLIVLLLRGLVPTTVNVTLTTPQAVRDEGITGVKEDGKTAVPMDQTPSASSALASAPVATPTPTPLQTAMAVTPPAPTIEEQIAAQMKDAVFLIQVEKGGRCWPFATCCAIGKNTLLTSAREASILYNWRQDPENGFKIWITIPERELKIAVKDIYVNAVYTTFADKPTDWIYYNFALLTVAEELPKVVELASREELDQLAEGFPVYCCGFAQEGEKITKFDRFQPQLAKHKVWAVAASPNLPSIPRLLQIKGKPFMGAYGSPLVNDRGQIVAIYGETVQPPGMEELSLAPVLDPKMIDLWLRQNDKTMWVSPDILKSDSKPKDKK